jgi:glycerol-3-phosphate acyltransferase PlsY
MNMEILPALLAVVAGYLTGSVSFARIVVGVVAPGVDITHTRVVMPDNGEVLESDAVSPTVVRLHLGSRYGCLTGILDMGKVFVPALLLRILFPDSYAYILFAAAAAVGHNWPIYYRFQGGRGQSPITGGFLVMAPVGALVCTAVSVLVGVVARDRILSGILMMVLMIPWVLLTTRDWVLVLYTAAMTVLFVGSMMPELRQYARMKREGRLEALAEARIEGGAVRGTGLLRDDADMPQLQRLLHPSHPPQGDEGDREV